MELLIGFLRNPKFKIRPIYQVLQDQLLPLSREVASKVAVRPSHPTGGRVWLADECPDGARRNSARPTRAARVRR